MGAVCSCTNASNEINDRLSRAEKTGTLTLANIRQLKKVPQGVYELTKLRVLNLDCNALTQFPGELAQLPKLKNLSLASNSITCTELVPIVSPAMLQSGYQHLPFQGFLGLTTLNLEQNRLTSVPAWIWQIPHLKHLNLAGNLITEFQHPRLPPNEEKDFSDIKTNSSSTTSSPHPLKELNLAHNNISVLPSSLFREIKLHALYELNLAANNITTIAEDLLTTSNFPALKRVQLTHNRLTALPASLLKHAKVSTIEFEGNPVHDSYTYYKLDGWKQYERRHKLIVDKGIAGSLDVRPA